ncbi:AtpZ/AtpI family protein [Jeotgalibaca sp. MA1X17-3]|uniref:AtpZ/AtpI family protein n=1 Tax=Jeotgalibaca sp. MA1X17-3 TaxID=2908211 RepID=UPI0021065B95|nr:AtpZ/AtpI family protein [Jeotgalibaca sp. MA1X17-3]
MDEELLNEIEKDANKKLKSKEDGKEIMFGLGLFGIVGWSIAVPTLLGIALGTYLDKKVETSFSWTLTLIFVGVIVGAFNTWRWLNENNNKE